MANLKEGIALDDFGRPQIGAIVAVGPLSGTPPITQPVEIDWMRKRLYFTMEDAVDARDPDNPALKYVDVSYTNSAGEDRTERTMIAFTEEDLGREGSQGGTSFGTLASVMVNEGQINALKDPWDPKVWAFWVSTREGNTDVYYEAISPKFYGVKYTP
jgi:hypothetical protein